MRDWIRNRLDAYEGRHQKRDEEFAAFVNQGIDAMSDRRTLRLFLGILLFANLVIWLSVIIFPFDVREVWSKVIDLDDKIGAGVIGIVWGIGMWLTYSLIRLRMPDLEDQNLDSEMFGSLTYHARSSRRWWVWVASVTGGVFNVLFLVIADICLSSNA